ncbi:MAG: NUDIX domain-containing protein [Candidatus Wildermuthbacteria bacterium]|nr:NUDIX domain-containing protein [Candidatus Wildermuthbacteria bacterium]
MTKEKSAGAVVYYMVQQNEPLYLLLHYPSSMKAKDEYWDFPKGHIEKGEEEQEAARREIGEETGLKDVVFQEGFQELIHYYFQFQGKKISKDVVFFLAQTKKSDVSISFEHKGFVWLPYEQALKRLKYDNAKNILKKAQAFLGNRQGGQTKTP